MITEVLSDFPKENLHDIIEESRNTDEDATAKKEWRNYALGRHNPVADETRKRLLGDMDVGDITENLVGQCLSQISGRMRFRKYLVDSPEVTKWLDEWSKKVQMGRSVVALTNRVQTDGNAAMSVSWRPDRDKEGKPIRGKGRVMLHHESWWDGNTGMFVAVSSTGDVYWACSEWFDRDKVRSRTVYEPHRITKWKQEGKEGWTMQGDEIDWTKKNGDPIGVPVAHFPNGASPFGPYAPSTVAQVMAAQDALNASLFNRQAVSAMTGSQIYWGTGIPKSDDIDVSPGTLWTALDPAAKFGAISPGSMDSLLTDTDDLRGVISGAFPVPSYRVGRGDWPSGLALQRSDAPMIAQVNLLSDVETPGLIMLAHRGTEISNTFGGTDLNEDAIIDVEWESVDEVDPGTKVEIDTATVALYKDLEDLTEVLLRKSGILKEDEIVELLEELKKRDQEVVGDANRRNVDDEDNPSSW